MFKLRIFFFVYLIGGLPRSDSVCLWHVQPGGCIVEHVCGGRIV